MIKIEELEEIHSNPELRSDNSYSKLISINQNPWEELDNVVDCLRRWQKRMPIGKNFEIIKRTVLSLKKYFDKLESYELDNFQFNEQNESTIRSIFDELSATQIGKPRLGGTGDSKLMHFVNPRLFMMWDDGICRAFGISRNSKGYITFMKEMQKEAKEILKQCSKEEFNSRFGCTIPKILDEYNWEHYRTSKNK